MDMQKVMMSTQIVMQYRSQPGASRDSVDKLAKILVKLETRELEKLMNDPAAVKRLVE